MKPDSRCLLLPLLLQAGLTLANDELSAGSRHRCVPNADRTGWECAESGNGGRDNSKATIPTPEPEPEPIAESTPTEPESTPLPEPYLEPATAVASEPTPAPPPLVAAPPEEATPLSDFYRAVPEHEPTTSPSPETVMSEPQAISSAPEPEPAVAPEPEPIASEPVAIEPEPEAPVATEPEPALAAEPAPEPAPSEPVLEPEPAPVSTATPVSDAPAEAPAPEPAASSAPAASAWQLSDLATARDFANLNGNAYTLQLADAASPQAFPQLIAELGLAPASCYVLKVKRDGQDWWLLAHGEFADANTAKSLLARLPNVPGLTRNWPRKIQYLQREFDTVGR